MFRMFSGYGWYDPKKIQRFIIIQHLDSLVLRYVTDL